MLRNTADVAGAALIVLMLVASTSAVVCPMLASQNCSAQDVRNGQVSRYCVGPNAVSPSSCTTDTCLSYTTVQQCVMDTTCASVPVDSISICLSKKLLCWSLKAANCASSARPYCQWVNGSTDASSYCNYIDPKKSATAMAAALTDNNCPAIHPAVLAILIIMFITLLAAIIVVAVVVCFNKKKQEELDKEEEEIEAERAQRRL